MTSKQWRMAWRIFTTAREIPVAERRPFVESESGDPEIVRRVFELLESPPEFDETSYTPAVSREGTRVGRYLVGTLLGRGGMGEVYAARDTDLDRPVALKFLLPQAIGDPAAVKRFIREAKAASALNHPNIMTVYEVIQSSSGLAIAMELVEGKPLVEFRGTALPVTQVIEIGRQVASALATAHEHGIVHRDIKPENLMVRPDGFVKVLDFGLARDFAGELAATLQPSVTGMPAGTLRYMSPEQLRDEPVTGSSDVFSFGIVLYELAAGRHPFASEYAWETAYAIHTREPAPASAVNRDVPAWLDELILSMLRRDPALRPSAHQVESGLAFPAGIVNSTRSRLRMVRLRLFRTRSRRVFWALPVIALTVFAWIPRRDVPADANLKFTPLTTFGGSKSYPVFSPDGSSIAFSWRPSSTDTQHIYTKPVANGDAVQLTFGSEEDAFAAWSPDGRQIAFGRRRQSPDERARTSYGIFLVPAGGGADRKITDAWTGVSWSPDGKTLAVARVPGDSPDSGGIDLVSIESGSRLRLSTSREDLLPAFSPDGNWVAFIRVLPGRGRGRDVFVVPATGGPSRQLTFDATYVTGLTWTADSREVLFSSPRNPAQGAFWRVRVSGGAPRPLSTALRNASFPSISRQGRRMVFSESWSDSNLHIRASPGFPRAGIPWRFDDAAGIVLSSGVEHSADFSPDGERFAFISDRTGNNEIWVSDRDGRQAVQLTAFGTKPAGSPRWSPDGASIVFDLFASNESNVYIVNSHGGAPRRLSSEPGASWNPAWSHDAAWVYYMSDRSGKQEIWKAPAAGGAAIQITHGGAYEGRPSSDGNIVYFRKSMPAGCCAIWSVPAGGGREEPVRELEKFGTISRSWGVLPEGLFFVARENRPRQTVRFLDFATREVVEVVKLEKEPDWSFPGVALSPDGRYLLNVQIDRETNDLIMIENFR